jgi:hypothetical protein
VHQTSCQLNKIGQFDSLGKAERVEALQPAMICVSSVMAWTGDELNTRFDGCGRHGRQWEVVRDAGENAARNGARSEKSQNECCERGQGEHGRAPVECQVAICCGGALSASVPPPGFISYSGMGRRLPFQDLLTKKPEERETALSIFRQFTWGLWKALASAEKVPCGQATGRSSQRGRVKGPVGRLDTSSARNAFGFATDNWWQSLGAQIRWVLPSTSTMDKSKEPVPIEPKSKSSPKRLGFSSLTVQRMLGF